MTRLPIATWPSLKYSMGTLLASVSDLHLVLDLKYFHILSYLGINRNIRKELRVLPAGFLGMGLYDLDIETTIAWVQLFVQHYRQPSLVGVTLQDSLEYLQLEIGSGGVPFMINTKFLGGWQ